LLVPQSVYVWSVVVECRVEKINDIDSIGTHGPIQVQGQHFEIGNKGVCTIRTLEIQAI